MLQTDKEDVDLKDLHDHIDELVSHEMNVLWAASRDYGDCIDWSSMLLQSTSVWKIEI